MTDRSNSPASPQPATIDLTAADRSASPGTVKPKGLYVMDEKTFPTVYGPAEQESLARLLEIAPDPWGQARVRADTSILREVEIIVASWGMPVMDEAFLEAAPRLKAVFYGAGSVRAFTTPAFWKRDIVLSSAYATNAFPVSEYTLGVILLSLKRFWAFAQSVKAGTDPWDDHLREVPGAFRSTVGLVSCGMVARSVIRLLKAFDLRCIVYCPFLTEEEAVELGVERLSLAEVFRQSDIVSVHTPILPETRGLITGDLISSMKPQATLINTARGAVICETEMIEVLRARPDLFAVLDVCDPEPPTEDSALVPLPNVILTPHISGSLGRECRRLGHCMVEEVRRYVAGEPLQWKITREFAARLA